MRQPTERTLRWLRAAGKPCKVVEKWVAIKGHPAGGVRRDVWGADIIAITSAPTLIQDTSGSNVGARLRKLAMIPEVVGWLAVGGAFWIVGWRKMKAGPKAKVWRARGLRLQGVTPETLHAVEIEDGYEGLKFKPAPPGVLRGLAGVTGPRYTSSAGSGGKETTPPSAATEGEAKVSKP